LHIEMSDCYENNQPLTVILTSDPESTM